MLNVPGANLYYEVRGSGPVLLMMPGGPADASAFVKIADNLAADHTVVTYDPRGLSRSTVDEPIDFDRMVQLYADDVHHLLNATSKERAFVYASSGGATISLDLAARYGEQINTLVVHEPPSPALQPDPVAERAPMLSVVDAYHSNGMRAAMDRFLVVARFPGEPPPPPPADPTPEMLEGMARMQRNMEVFFGDYIRAIANFEPDIAALRTCSCRIVPAVGEGSKGEVAHDGALGLARLLGTEAVVFPGAHAGFESHPDQFADRLRSVMEG